MCPGDRCTAVFAGFLAGLGAACLVVLITLGLYVPPAKGETLQTNHYSCLHLGSVVIDAMEVRDGGVKWPEFEAFVRGQFAQARKNPKSYIQSDADEAYVLAALSAAWNSRKDSVDAATDAYNACMAKRI